MILSAVKILELNEKYNLVDNLCERELKNSEGVCLDLRVGQIYRLIGDSLLCVDETGGKRYSPEIECIGNIESDKNKLMEMKPGDYWLVTTMESVNSPAEKIKYHPDFPEGYLVPKIFPRVSLQKGGLTLNHTGTNPGWHGQLTFGLFNGGNQNFNFELGARMFSVEYHSVIGEIKRAYSGQHQGGRVTSDGKTEKQN